MRWRFRKSKRLGPLRVTATERGVTWGLKAGRWSWNPRTRRHTLDTPGIGSVTWRSGSSSRRRSSGSRRREPAPKASPILGLLGLVVAVVVGYAWLIGALPV